MRLTKNFKSYIGYFTTNKKIASDGLKDYLNFLGKIDTVTMKFIENHPEIKLCFMGVFPEIGANSKLFNDFDIEKFEKFLPRNYIIVKHDCKSYSLFNLKSAWIVIKNNKELFGNFINTTEMKNYLISNKDSYFLPGKEKNRIDKFHVGIRYGLLSGYPKICCILYPYFYHNEENQMDIVSVLSKKYTKGYIFEGHTIGAYIGFCIEYDKEFDKTLREIIGYAYKENSTLLDQKS
jgi:hypothetical protein